MPTRFKKFGILGGTFDPVHCGHINLAIAAQEQFELDLALLIPANISPHKHSLISTSSEHRLNMLKLAVKGAPQIQVLDLELIRGGISFTTDTLQALMAQHPQTEFFLILGVDTFEDFGSWKDHQKIAINCNLLIASRPGYKTENPQEFIDRLFGKKHPYQLQPQKKETIAFLRKDNRKSLVFFYPNPHNISSTEIRRRIRENLPIKNMLPPKVEHYIIEHHLYQASPQSHRE